MSQPRRPVAQQLSLATDWPVVRLPALPRRACSRRRHVLRGEQLPLCLANPNVLTPLVADIERIIRRVVQSGAPMPNNPVLGALAGNRGRSSAQRAVARLVKLRRIKVETRHGERRAVLPSGAATGWGEARQGHAPYCTTKKGQPKPPPKRGPCSPAMPATVQLPAIVVKPAEACQMPMWPDGAKPNGHYCGAPVVGRTSWCCDHGGKVVDVALTKAMRVRLR